nr:uncharacterized protein LOC129475382 [Symphalangus syndactylus]
MPLPQDHLLARYSQTFSLTHYLSPGEGAIEAFSNLSFHPLCGTGDTEDGGRDGNAGVSLPQGRIGVQPSPERRSEVVGPFPLARGLSQVRGVFPRPDTAGALSPPTFFLELLGAQRCFCSLPGDAAGGAYAA